MEKRQRKNVNYLMDLSEQIIISTGEKDHLVKNKKPPFGIILLK